MRSRLVAGLLPILLIGLGASEPLTPRVDEATFHSFEQVMSSSDARNLQTALGYALGFNPQTRQIEGSWDYRKTLWTKAETTALNASCSSIRLEAYFSAAPEGQILLQGVYCLTDIRAMWSTQSQQITHLPGVPAEISSEKTE